MFKSEETHLKKLWASLERREKQALRATNYFKNSEVNIKHKNLLSVGIRASYIQIPILLLILIHTKFSI